MAKLSLAGFKDPVRRPRYIIWTGVVVLVLAAVVITALGVTSTKWFCAEGCHKVQDDAIFAYDRSSHSKVSCMACHMPVGANPIVFVLHKAEALGELYMTVTDKFELPLNAESEVSLSKVMASRQCTQCHNLDNRTITPSAGIKIDHKVHGEVNIACTVCHNRVAHNESGDFEPKLKDPNTKKQSVKHENFMAMTACFRCHGLEEGAAAPGTCSACHPADFELKPASHNEDGFYPKGHAEMAKEAKGEAEGTGAEAAGAEEAGAGEAKKVSPEEVTKLIEEQKEIGASDKANIGEELPTVKSVFYCGTCHKDKFCTDCHGMEMPHPASFKEPKDPKAADGHPVLSKSMSKKCVMCHGTNQKTAFCDKCHHGTKVNWEFDTKTPWTAKQHPKAVAASGVKSCTSCHVVKFCVNCHTGRRVVPSSHRARFWTKPKFPGALTVLGTKAAQPTALHTQEAQKSIESCEVCHGTGGIKARFCKSCHKVDLPHADEFKSNHVSAKKNTRPCVQCHSWKQLCSNCHHVGSSFSRPWTAVHGASVNKNGAANCVEKCHKASDCVKCHTKRRVKPASHRGSKFVRDFSSKKALHVQFFQKDATICTYCHPGDAATLPTSKFCTRCHKLEMPHPSGFGPPQGEKPTKDNGGQHAASLKAHKLSKSVCANCHKTNFCNSCHHQGASASRPWVRFHPVVVKKSGATPCFDCHSEVFCSNCHVRRAAQIMGR